VLFNSFTFLIFLPIVFLLYWFVFQKNLKLQNAFLLLLKLPDAVIEETEKEKR